MSSIPRHARQVRGPRPWTREIRTAVILAAALTWSLAATVALADGGGRSIWVQRQKLVEVARPEQNDRFGWSVAVDGDTLVVGAPLDGWFGVCQVCGSVYVFVLDGATWTLQDTLHAGDPEYGAEFGATVDISGDTLVVGSPEDSHSGYSDIGSAYVFVRSGTTWSQQQKLITGEPANFQAFGESVAIDGDTVAVGDTRRNVGGMWESGSVTVFVRSGTSWSEQAVLIGDDTVDLPLGGAATYSVACTVDPGATGTLLTTATVTPPMGWDDPVPANNSATDSDILTPEVDLAVTKGNGTDEINFGEQTAYTIEVANPGPSDVSGAAVSDPFPPELSACSWTCTPSPGASCAASGTNDLVDTVDLPAGGNVTYTVTCMVAGVEGTCTNTVTASVPMGVTERDPSDNSATDVDTVIFPPSAVSGDGFDDGTTAGWSVTVP